MGLSLLRNALADLGFEGKVLAHSRLSRMLKVGLEQGPELALAQVKVEEQGFVQELELEDNSRLAEVVTTQELAVEQEIDQEPAE